MEKEMKIVAVVPSRYWLNTKTLQRASLFGAVPYGGEVDRADWMIVEKGFTWQKDDGTYGLGRRPAETYEEAVEVMNKVNALGG